MGRDLSRVLIIHQCWYWVVMLYYSFTKRYHWEELSKGYQGPLCVISYNRM